MPARFPDKGDVVKCAWCGLVFTCRSYHDEALAEKLELYGSGSPLSEMDMICDDCFELDKAAREASRAWKTAWDDQNESEGDDA